MINCKTETRSFQVSYGSKKILSMKIYCSLCSRKIFAIDDRIFHQWWIPMMKVLPSVRQKLNMIRRRAFWIWTRGLNSKERTKEKRVMAGTSYLLSAMVAKNCSTLISQAYPASHWLRKQSFILLLLNLKDNGASYPSNLQAWRLVSPRR